MVRCLGLICTQGDSWNFCYFEMPFRRKHSAAVLVVGGGVRGVGVGGGREGGREGVDDR